MGGKAVLMIDGGKPRTMSAGQTTPEGVKLISADKDSATVEVAGKRETLHMGQRISINPPVVDNPSVTLYADSGGHFFATATINDGGTTRFLVDTGATVVTLGKGEAKKLGISYLSGERRVMITANGIAPVYLIKLDSVKVGAIKLANVEAAVDENDRVGMPLLGMSFLNRVDMKRDGEKMTLIKRY